MKTTLAALLTVVSLSAPGWIPFPAPQPYPSCPEASLMCPIPSPTEFTP